MLALLTTTLTMAMCIWCTNGINRARAAVPPLSESQKAQLASAIDDSPIVDEGAWYPLLQNAMTWEGDVSPGSLVPDYSAMLQMPAVFRGKLFFIRGKFAGRSKYRTDLKVGRLARPGPWDQTLAQWPILVSRDPDFVAIVYLVDPGPQPPVGAPVEIVARFYKTWETVDLQDVVTRYLVFVGRRALLAEVGTGPQSPKPHIMLLLIIVLAMAYLILRRQTATARHLLHDRLKAQRNAPPSSTSWQDRAEALAAMDHRNQDGTK